MIDSNSILIMAKLRKISEIIYYEFIILKGFKESLKEYE